MKFKTILLAIAVSVITLSAFSQNPKDKRKAPKNKHDKMWDKKVFKNGKDTRFSKHKRKKYRKPGDDR